MRVMHTKCGGEIDVKTRQCRRCKKRWDPVSFKLDPIGIRPMLDARGRPLPDREGKGVTEEEYTPSIPRWMQHVVGAPYLDAVVSKLPKWPRWARILTASAILAGAVLLIIYLT